jgi:glycosyltransferase involved in cell wall biosynthesis
MTTDPAVSVVIATRNRAGRLVRALESLRNQTLPPDRFEVVVVDDASEDHTQDVLSMALRRGDLPLCALRNLENRGAADSRNVGWRAARAPLIAFTDDDCEPERDWLSALVGAHRAHPGALLQGRTEPIPAERASIGPFARTIVVRSLGPYYPTCNVAYPADVLEEVGGFDGETFKLPGGEDTDLAWRALSRGIAAVLVDDAVVHHAVNQLGACGTLRLAMRWSDTMAAIARHPGLRRHLARPFVWRRSHELFLRALLGAALARRLPPALLLAYPYARQLRARARGGPAWAAAFLPICDAVEVYATARGAIRHRVLII